MRILNGKPAGGRRRGASRASNESACWRLLLLLIPALTGCTTTLHQWKHRGYKVGPDYCKPSASLEVEWIDLQSDPRLVNDEPDLARWWYALNDPVLNGLIESAYRQNLTLRQAGTRIRQAEAIQGIAVGNLFPQLQTAVGDYQRIQTSQNVAVPSPVVRFDQFNLGLGAAWELDFWGRFRRSIAVADANLDASIAGYDDVTVILLSSVAATYVEIRTLQERISIARTIIDLQRGSLEIAEARFRAQETNKLDVIQAKNNIAVTEAAIPVLEAQLRIANDRLCVLLGLPPHDLVSQLPPAPIPTVSRNVQVGIPADLLRRRPDIRRSERLMRAQSERIGIAEADLYPRISLIGSFEWQAENIEDLFNSGSVFGLISPGFSWNVLNYGRIVNSIELERQRFRETVYQYRQNVLTAQQEVEDAIIAFLKAQEQADRLDEAVEQVNEAEQIAQTLYRTGATDFNRVFLIQAFQFSQQDQLVVARASEVLNLIKIYRALGGGWQIRCANYDIAAAMMIPMEQSGGMIDSESEVDKAEAEPGETGAERADEPQQLQTSPADAQPDTVPSDSEPEPAAEPRQKSESADRLKELLEEGQQDDKQRRSLEDLLNRDGDGGKGAD